MVQDTGKALCTDISLRRINIPEPAKVEESSSGGPAMITMARPNSETPLFKRAVIKTARRQAITFIDDCWRIDDEWWRNEPVSRLYYAVRLASGQRLVIYKDLINGQWYKQTY